MSRSKCNRKAVLPELMMTYVGNEIAMSKVNVAMAEHISRRMKLSMSDNSILRHLRFTDLAIGNSWSLNGYITLLFIYINPPI